MKICASNRIDLFMNALGARRPSPGGGAAAALTGAVGAALVAKVANYTIGKKKYGKYEKEAMAITKEILTIRNKIACGIEWDARAYDEYSKTKSKAALRKATKCVAEIARLSREALKRCERLKRIGNKNLKGDLYAAGLLLGASAKAADNLVKLNKKWMGR